MANRTLYPSWAYGAGRVWMDFELLGNGTGNPTLSTDAPQAVASVVRQGVGIHLVTLKDAFQKVTHADCNLNDTANDGSYATIGAISNEGTSNPLTFIVYTRTSGGTLADLAVGRRLGLSVVLRNSKGWGLT